MDANKLKVLQALPYQIQKVCGLCKHGVFPLNDWGTCGVYEYTHEKHTGEPRKLSILKYGSCPSFEAYESQVQGLGAYQEFLT